MKHLFIQITMTIVMIGSMLVFAGCRTSFKNPLDKTVSKFNGDTEVSVFQYTRQGSIPASLVYRSSWPNAVVIIESTNGESEVRIRGLSAEVIGSFISAATKVVMDAEKGYLDTYMYREDIFLKGKDIDLEAIKTIMERGSLPKLDVQRSPWQEGE